MGHLIRKAEVKDATEIAKIHVETWQSHYRGQISDDYLDKLSIEEREKKWKERLNNLKPETAVFVSESNGEILGFCWVGPDNDKDEANDVGELYAIYIAQNYQGRGLGSDLMKTGLEYLRKEGFKKAVLWVLKTNISTIKFYESKGWKANGKEKADKRGGVTFEDVGYSIEL